MIRENEQKGGVRERKKERMVSREKKSQVVGGRTKKNNVLGKSSLFQQREHRAVKTRGGSTWAKEESTKRLTEEVSSCIPKPDDFSEFSSVFHFFFFIFLFIF